MVRQINTVTGITKTELGKKRVEYDVVKMDPFHLTEVADIDNRLATQRESTISRLTLEPLAN